MVVCPDDKGGRLAAALLSQHNHDTLLHCDTPGECEMERGREVGVVWGGNFCLAFGFSCVGDAGLMVARDWLRRGFVTCALSSSLPLLCLVFVIHAFLCPRTRRTWAR